MLIAATDFPRWLLLLLLAQVLLSQGHAADAANKIAPQRHLTAAHDFELQYSLTMTVPTSLTSGVKASLSIPNYLGKQPGAPSPVQPRQLQHHGRCVKAQPTFVLIPGKLIAVLALGAVYLAPKCRHPQQLRSHPLAATQQQPH